jgi:hypothetical protein
MDTYSSRRGSSAGVWLAITVFPLACSETPPDGGLTAEEGGSGSLSATISATDTESATGIGDASLDAGDDTGGLKLDVGAADDGITGVDTNPTLGACRESEVFGAAGGYPHFTDPAYASFLDRQVAIMTSFSYTAQEYELRVIDISGDPPPPNMGYAAPIYTHPGWTSTAFGGGLFGLTLDSAGNIYVAASTVYGSNSTPGTIYKIDAETAAVSTFATLPNTAPAFGNINYDCVSESLRVVSHEDCRIYQLDMNGTIVSTYHHGLGDVTLGAANDPGEPDGQFCPLGQRMWAVQSHYGRLYYSVWWEDGGRQNPTEDNEIWSVAYVDDQEGIPDPATKQLEATIPGLGGNTFSNPVSDLSFAQTGWMLAAERTMYADNSTSAHQSTTYELQQMNGTWQVVGTTYIVGELPNSSAGGVDHDFEENGYVWMTGDALDFNTPAVVYGIQGTPYGGGDITNSTLIDHDNEVTQQDKTALGDVEIPIPGDAEPPPPPPEG